MGEEIEEERRSKERGLTESVELGVDEEDRKKIETSEVE